MPPRRSASSCRCFGVRVAGLLAGIAIDRSVLARPPRAVLMQRSTPPDVDRLVGRMRRLLDLDEEQAAQVREMLARRQPQIAAAWTQARTALLAQVDSALGDFSAVLTPEQQERLARALTARGIETRRR